MSMSDLIQSADFKTEKHAPVIEIPTGAATGQAIDVKVSVGKEIAHPNTTEHFIEWIALYFKPNGAKFAIELGKTEFKAHGAAAQGANTGPAHTEPCAVFRVKIDQPGTFTAVSYCNIHGLWESDAKIG